MQKNGVSAVHARSSRSSQIKKKGGKKRKERRKRERIKKVELLFVFFLLLVTRSFFFLQVHCFLFLSFILYVYGYSYRFFVVSLFCFVFSQSSLESISVRSACFVEPALPTRSQHLARFCASVNKDDVQKRNAHRAPACVSSERARCRKQLFYKQREFPICLLSLSLSPLSSFSLIDPSLPSFILALISKSGLSFSISFG